MLTEENIEDLVVQCCAGDEDAVRELADAAASDPGRVAPHHARLIAAGVFGRGEVYRGADEATTGELVRLADAADGVALGELLDCVANAHPVDAERAFRRWQLAEDVGVHTRDAGWELTPSGTRRDLLLGPAFALLPVDAEDIEAPEGTAGGPDGPPVFGTPSGEHCPWCGMELHAALDLPPGSAAARALGLTGPDHVRVLCCPRCTDFDIILSAYDGSGGARWLEHNVRPSFNGPTLDGWDPYPTRLVLGPARPDGGSGSAWHDGGSALGGHPDWIQDPDRPDCPLCGRAMVFASMNGGADLWGGEGCLYVFVDLDCRTGAVLYQQS
ncbi:hypothetical protein ABTY61_28230 [Kitasatospora sp. NPDC096128]|uniref:hypothetical protein n=1 Tax=Kitasatospora sp. NPDC096128 TaxID=3155547 RepID=UPI00332D0EB7